MSWIRQGIRVVVAGALACAAIAAFGSRPAPSAKRMEIAVSSLSLSPNTITTGATSTATVKLTDIAPSGGVIVSLESDKLGVTVPKTVAVAEGKDTATFKVSAAKDAALGMAALSAKAGGVTKTAQLHLLPYIVSAGFTDGMEVNTRLYNSVFVTLSAAAQQDVTVTIWSDYIQAFPRQTITIPAGVKSYTVHVEMGRTKSSVHAYMFFQIADSTIRTNVRFI